MTGSQINLPKCPGCGKPHAIWFKGESYFAPQRPHFFLCPEVEGVLRVQGIEAGWADTEKNDGDIEGWMDEPTPPKDHPAYSE